MQAAGRQTQLRELLLRYDWLDARLEQDGIWPVLADYALSAPDDAIRRLTEALRRSVQTLTADPQQLPAQLFGRLGDDPQLAVLLDAAARDTRRCWLRPLTPMLTPPEDPLLWTLEGHTAGIHRWR